MCIIGAGPAGITLALELQNQQFQVSLIESGGLEADADTQRLYRGTNTGQPYFDLDDARERRFGGSSNLWNIDIGQDQQGQDQLGVRMHPLDAIDFEKRDWIPYSGWPFSKEHLDPFYERAQQALKLGPNRYDLEYWAGSGAMSPLPFTSSDVESTIFQFASAPQTIFGIEYRTVLEKAENVTIYLNANALEIETAHSLFEATSVTLATLSGNTFRLRAKVFILATGGIENARLLLLSNKTQTNGLGNQHDLVGRFFMEHPHLNSGVVIPADPNMFETTGLYQVHRGRGDTAVQAMLTISDETLRREKMLNYCVSLEPNLWPISLKYRMRPTPAIESAIHLSRAIRQRKIPSKLGNHLTALAVGIPGVVDATYKKMMRKVEHRRRRTNTGIVPEVFLLNHMAEQIPDPESRITLGDEKDQLGQNQIQLHWKLNAQDMQSMIRAQKLIQREFEQSRLGQLLIQMQGDAPPHRLQGGWHHMGTTRMHRNPKLGVVNEDDSLHETHNVFVAGSSVFPTGGYANPTLTIIALAIRLADYVAAQINHPSAVTVP
ncbi:GMC family oxidoreductase [Chloroflexi bacterium TSY]|nr:GMC family oxidoreductase [Chloroflexi bacterium TSY]